LGLGLGLGLGSHRVLADIGEELEGGGKEFPPLGAGCQAALMFALQRPTDVIYQMRKEATGVTNHEVVTDGSIDARTVLAGHFVLSVCMVV